jgi:hypothetical protein
MGFFDDLRLPSREVDDEENYETPAWLAPPADWVAGVVALELVVAVSEQAAVYLTRLAAYPTGFSVTVEALTRKRTDISAFDLMHRRPVREEDEDPPAELLRFGVEFADNRKATTLGGMFGGSVVMAFGGDGEEPNPETEIHLTTHGGGGSDRHSIQDCWIWPLPPQGVVTFACEWPAMEIPETAIELEAATIRDASERAQRVWQT